MSLLCEEVLGMATSTHAAPKGVPCHQRMKEPFWPHHRTPTSSPSPEDFWGDRLPSPPRSLAIPLVTESEVFLLHSPSGHSIL